MSLKAFLLTISLSTLCAAGYPQATLSVSFSEERLDRALEYLQQNSDYSFVFGKDALSGAVVRNVKMTNSTMEQILDQILTPNGFQYEIVRDRVVVVRRQQVPPQERVLSGRVTDDGGRPMAGVTVMVEGTTTGTITDTEGKYTIRIPASGKPVLRFSFLGFRTELVDPAQRTTVDVAMSEEASAIDQVVVTGYQTLSMRESAGSTTQLDMDKIRMDGAFSVDQMLQGRVPGMTVMNESGEPSATPRIRIRGNATISGNKSPVWVVDGIIREMNTPFSASDINGEDAPYLIGSAISGLNPQDIESITILKDASATAIYGVKAANGVIVITTKKGSPGEAQVRYNGSVTIGTRPSYRNYEIMDSRQRVRLSKEIVDAKLTYDDVPRGESYEYYYAQLLNKGITEAEFAEQVSRLQGRNMDWFRELFRPTVSHSHSLNVSGGGKRADYYVSASYNKSLGASVRSSSERYGVMAKTNVAITKWLDLEVKLDYSSTGNEGYSQRAGVNPFDYVYNTSRTVPARNPDGSYHKYIYDGYMYNILSELDNTGANSRLDNFGGVLALRARLLPGLSYLGVFSITNANTNTRDWATAQSYYVTRNMRGYEYGAYDETSVEYQQSTLPYGGVIDMGNIRNRGYTVRNTIEYRNSVGERHDFHAIAGVEASSNKYTGQNITGYGWNPDMGEVFLPVLTDQFVGWYVEQGRLMPRITNQITQVASFYGTFAYTYDNRYVLNANIRSDGSNKFGSDPKYRWQPNWSVAAKWIVSAEKFMEGSETFNLLALRASYGTQGNIHPDATPNLITRFEGRSSSGLDYHSIVRVPNTSLRWEKTKSWNAALDFSLFSHRLHGSFDIYRKNTSDLIITKYMPSSMGRSSVSINAGRMVNSGFEFFLNADILRGNDLEWRAGINFGRNINQVKLADDELYGTRELVNKMLSGELAVEGAPVGSMYAYRFAGLSGSNGLPFFYAKDGRKVHKGDAELMELVRVGSVYPLISGGFDTQLTWRKSLSLSLAFTYNLGNVKRLPSIYPTGGRAFNPLDNTSTELNNRWRQPGDENRTNLPALYDENMDRDMDPSQIAELAGSAVITTLNPMALYAKSDVRTAKASFLKLKSVTLSYNMPRQIVEKINVSALNVRLQVSNIFTIAGRKWRGLDPESYGANIPLLPQYSLSLDISF